MARFSKGDRAAFFLDMRLGKSLTTILWAREQGYRRVLLVAPSTPLIDWSDELQEAGNEHWMVLGSAAKRAAVLASRAPGWYLTTYGSLTRTPSILQAWDLIVLDESTTIKNPKAGVTKFCFKHLHGCTQARAVLSGCPAPQDDLEVWTQMAWTMPDKRWLGFSNYWKFREAFCAQRGFSWVVKNSHLPILKQAMHRDAFILSRKDAGLPTIKQRLVHKEQLDPDAAAAQTELLETWKLDGEEYKLAPVVAGVAHRIAGGFSPARVYPCWKYGYLYRLLQEEDGQAVVWFAYNAEIHRMRSWLAAKGVTCSVLTGSDALPQRKLEIQKFRSGETRVFLGQVACGKFGLDLSVADLEVYFSCPYSYEGRRQSEERVVHPTKKRSILVLDLVSVGSADEVVQDVIRDRKNSTEYYLARFNSRFKMRAPPG